jgi:hypothetical protein
MSRRPGEATTFGCHQQSPCRATKVGRSHEKALLSIRAKGPKVWHAGARSRKPLPLRDSYPGDTLELPAGCEPLPLGGRSRPGNRLHLGCRGISSSPFARVARVPHRMLRTPPSPIGEARLQQHPVAEGTEHADELVAGFLVPHDDAISRLPQLDGRSSSRAARKVLAALEPHSHVGMPAQPRRQGEQGQRPLEPACVRADGQPGLDLHDDGVRSPSEQPDLDGGGDAWGAEVAVGGRNRIEGDDLDLVALGSEPQDLREETVASGGGGWRY